MNAKTLLVLVGAAGLTAVGAALALKNRESAVTVAQDTGRLLPDLIGSLNDVAVVSIRTPDASFTLERKDDVWTLAEKGGYTAQEEPIRKLLIGVAELYKVEAKTDDPSRFAKLGVEDVTAENAASKLVTLKNAAGLELASIVVGNTRPSQGGRRVKQVYVRRNGDDQSWLVEGEVDVKPNATDWLQQEVYSIPQSRIQSIEIEHADGEVLRLRKESEDEPSFTVLDVEEGRELRYPTIANPIASGLASVKLEDVQPAGEIAFEDEWLVRTTLRTFDGLTLRATLKEQGGKNYARFAASYEPPAGPPLPAQEAEDSEAAGASEDDGSEPVAEVKEVGPSPAEIRAEADRLGERFAEWTYVVPQHNRTTMTKRMAEMLKEQKPAQDESALGSDERPLVIPDTLPPEIREQIKAHQDSLGNKTVVRSPGDGADQAETFGDGADHDHDHDHDHDDGGGDER